MHNDGTNSMNDKPVVPREYQIFNPHTLVRVASATHAVESDNGVSTLIPRKRLIPLDRDLEEASSVQIGNYTCPYVNCPFGNYALGFSTRVKRNTHMLNCLYGNIISPQQHGGISDPCQIPSGRVFNKVVEPLAPEAVLNNKNTAGSSSQVALGNYSDPVIQGYSRIEIIPENNSQFNVSSKMVEPAPARQLPEINNCQSETCVFENSTYRDQLSGVANNNHFPEVGATQDGFHYLSPEMGGFLDSFSDGHFSAMDEFLYDAYGWIN